MISKYRRRALATAAGRGRGRDVTVRPDDALIVSYPRSGNTWMRFMVASLLSPEEAPSFESTPRLVPSIYETFERDLARLPSPRILKSHESFDPRYKKVLYIVRDPRDVMLSYYRYQLKTWKMDEGVSLERYAELFLTGEMSRYGSWREHVGSWLGAREYSNSFRLMRYEDLLADPTANLGKAAELLEIPASEEDLRRAVEKSTADKMRKQEASKGVPLNRWSRNDISFVGNATSGGWRDELPEALALDTQEAWGEMMERLGYS